MNTTLLFPLPRQTVFANYAASLAAGIFAITALGTSTAADAPAAAAGDVFEIGSRRELFVDRVLIERLSGSAKQQLHRPVPKEVVLTTDAAWEGNTSAYFTIFRDGDRLRMYYRGSHWDAEEKKATHREVTCYAESKDGIRWTKPELGLFEFGGSKANNIVLDGLGTHCFAAFKDGNPDCQPEARYKGIARGRPVGKKGLYATEAYYTGPDSRLRRFEFRKDGFVSIRADGGGGEMLTKPMRFNGAVLELNATTANNGSLRVEVQNAAGEPIDGFKLADCVPFEGDQIGARVSWSSGVKLGELAGKPVRLRFELKNADLYSFRFGK